MFIELNLEENGLVLCLIGHLTLSTVIWPRLQKICRDDFETRKASIRSTSSLLSPMLGTTPWIEYWFNELKQQ
jgi:hypothetical protein